jgi:hypothetical protein
MMARRTSRVSQSTRRAGPACDLREDGRILGGNIFLKELQLTLQGENPDGSRTEASGPGYLPGTFNGTDATVKDSKRDPETGGWGFYNFNHHEPNAMTASVRSKGEYASCHMAGAKKG